MRRDFSQAALVLVGHGSTVNPDSSVPTRAHARTIRARGVFREVHACFWKEEPPLSDILRQVESDEVFIVPNFISEGYFARTVIPRELHLTGPLTLRAGKTLKYCRPVGSHPGMTEVLLHRARETAAGVPPAETSLIIVGHGTGLHENSGTASRTQAARIAARGEYAEVFPAYMEETPRIADWDRLSTRPHVVVVPFFIADGLHSYEDIPVLLGIAPSGGVASREEIFRHNPHLLRGKRLYYGRAIGTGPALPDMIIDQAEAWTEEPREPQGEPAGS
jgi:sirohydrochlorin cobaltochelatase